MHREVLFKIAVGSVLSFSAIFVARAQTTPPKKSTVEQITARSLNGRCNDALYAYFPGVVNYCLGLHDVKRGDMRNGLQFLKLAAGWANKSAQYTLGLMYYTGDHVARDRALGIAWLKLANERHNDPQVERVTRSAIHWATPTVRKRATTLFRTLRGKYGDEVAANRAWQHLSHAEKASGSRWIGGGGCVVIPGLDAKKSVSAVNPNGKSPPGTSAYLKNLAKVKQSENGVCVPFATVHKAVKRKATVYFSGWAGKVTVGPLNEVPASASSAH